MDERNVQQIFWVEHIHIAVVILNKAHFIPNSDKTPYELWYGRPTIVKHSRVFGSKCDIKRNDEKLGKFDARVDEDIFIGYYHNRKGYNVMIIIPRGLLTVLMSKWMSILNIKTIKK